MRGAIAAPDLRRVRQPGDLEHELVEPDVGVDDAAQVACGGGPFHAPDDALELGEIPSPMRSGARANPYFSSVSRIGIRTPCTSTSGRRARTRRGRGCESRALRARARAAPRAPACGSSRARRRCASRPAARRAGARPVPIASRSTSPPARCGCARRHDRRAAPCEVSSGAKWSTIAERLTIDQRAP